LASSTTSAEHQAAGGAPSVYVALLRGINVGGHHKIAMADLRQVFAGLGLRDVTTYIQSGNVVFTSTRLPVAELTADIEQAIASAFAFDVPVVLRSAGDLAGVVSANPFIARGVDAAVISVGFLAGVPAADSVTALYGDPLADPAAAGGDEFVVRGEHVYLHHPNGYGRSKLTNSLFDRRLAVMMTVRNWRTVVTLLDMAGEAGQPS
jgi:uncharacterized protein (DUF1697 family)